MREDKNKDIESLFYNNKKDDIEEMIDEEKMKTKDLSDNLKDLNKSEENKDDTNSKTQVLEFTKKLKLNFEENAKENVKIKKNGISPLNIIGEINLFCIGYYIYILIFTELNDKLNYVVNGSIIVLLVFLFGLSTITKNKLSKFFSVLNFIFIILFITIHIYLYK